MHSFLATLSMVVRHAQEATAAQGVHVIKLRMLGKDSRASYLISLLDQYESKLQLLAGVSPGIWNAV